MSEILSIIFVTGSVLFAFAVALLGFKSIFGAQWSDATDLFYTLAIIALGYLFSAFYYFPPASYVATEIVVTCAAVFFLSRRFADYTPIGIWFYVSNIGLGISAMAWGSLFLVSIHVSLMTRALMIASLPLVFLVLPFGLLQLIEIFDVFCRKHWRRPRTPKGRITGFSPMVSLHVPVYAEPPEVVIGTLNAIRALRYDNYEVVVVDNNTEDEALWRPVEAHCKTLGPRFRFFHVSPMYGAKAGALNFAISHTAPHAEVIGIIDSDYHPSPDFIADLIEYFEDPKIGFVQTPHDYREWEGSTYLTMCYWEYKVFFHTVLVALNERDAAITIGTMCLLRKQAILDAGGWATWCVTEDSELAIRVHDAGYSSVYIPKTYGKGLIPETFGDYTKQRYRWVAGPVQELKHHTRHLLGWGIKKPQLTMLQRMHHLHHGFQDSMFGMNFPFMVLSVLLALSMVVHREVVPVPFPLWLSVTILLFTNFFLQWLQYYVLLGTTLKEMFMGLLANKALNYVMNLAAFRTMLNSSQKWRRTNKFKTSQTFGSALSSAMSEMVVGTLLGGSAIYFYSLMPVPGLLTMCLIGIAYKSIDHFAAPVLALISMHSQAKPAPTNATAARL